MIPYWRVMSKWHFIFLGFHESTSPDYALKVYKNISCVDINAKVTVKSWGNNRETSNISGKKRRQLTSFRKLLFDGIESTLVPKYGAFRCTEWEELALNSILKDKHRHARLRNKVPAERELYQGTNKLCFLTPNLILMNNKSTKSEAQDARLHPHPSPQQD